MNALLMRLNALQMHTCYITDTVLSMQYNYPTNASTPVCYATTLSSVGQLSDMPHYGGQLESSFAVMLHTATQQKVAVTLIG